MELFRFPEQPFEIPSSFVLHSVPRFSPVFGSYWTLVLGIVTTARVADSDPRWCLFYTRIRSIRSRESFGFFRTFSGRRSEVCTLSKTPNSRCADLSSAMFPLQNQICPPWLRRLRNSLSRHIPLVHRYREIRAIEDSQHHQLHSVGKICLLPVQSM